MHLSRPSRRTLVITLLVVVAVVAKIALALIATFLLWWYVIGEAMQADIVAPGVLAQP